MLNYLKNHDYKRESDAISDSQLFLCCKVKNGLLLNLIDAEALGWHVIGDE